MGDAPTAAQHPDDEARASTTLPVRAFVPHERIDVRVTGFRIGYVPGWEQASEADRVRLLVDYAPRWLAQWWTLLRARQVLADYYRGASMSNVWAAHAVELGCLASQWLEEHLEKEKLPAANVRKSNRDLTDAYDLANTHKHAGRDASRRVGRVLSCSVTPGGAAAITLGFAKPADRGITERDALELLDRCVAVWCTFLGKVGLDAKSLPD